MPRDHPRPRLFPYTTLFRSWEALVRRHERLVYAIGRSYRLGDEDMGDVFQDVFTALLKGMRSEEHTSELQSRRDLVCHLLPEKKKKSKCFNEPIIGATRTYA